MGMATPNHENVNANDYGPRAILATTRLSSFELKLSTIKSFCEGLLPDVYFGTKPSLFTSVEIAGSFYLSSRFVARFSFSRLGKRVLEEGNVTKVFLFFLVET